MTDQEHLERAYRRLLAWYPREFRRENEQEILAVLMADAPDGQHRPGLAQSADLIRSGLWLRLRPGVPRSARTVRAAVKLMYAGAVVSTVDLIIFLAIVGDIGAYHAILGYHLTAAQVSQLLNPLAITEAVVLALVPVALWVWMARETGRGRNWARGLSTVLFGLATLSLSSVFPLSGINISFVPAVRISFVPLLGPMVPVLTWLAGAAAVWLLWRPASTAFFKPPGYTQAQHRAQMAELDHQAQMAELAVQGTVAASRVREGNRDGEFDRPDHLGAVRDRWRGACLDQAESPATRRSSRRAPGSPGRLCRAWPGGWRHDRSGAPGVGLPAALAWYPRDFRHENEQEILAVLMADAPHGQRRPGLAESADLIRSGLWLRLRPSVPRSARTVRAAVKLMYAGAAVSTVNLIIFLALIGDIKAYHAILGHRLTAAQLSQASTPVITTFILWDLVPIAVWLWMARANGRGRNWARIVSTVLFGAATLNLTSAFNWLPPGNHLTLVPMIYGPTLPVLYWLVGLAVVWLLWRPASRAHFRPPGYTQAQHQAQMAELDHQAQMAELARIRARLPRHV